MDWKDQQDYERLKIIVMKFFVIVLAMRYVFQLLDKTSKKREGEIDWSNPSEHNVWW